MSGNEICSTYAHAHAHIVSNFSFTKPSFEELPYFRYYHIIFLKHLSLLISHGVIRLSTVLVRICLIHNTHTYHSKL